MDKVLHKKFLSKRQNLTRFNTKVSPIVYYGIYSQGKVHTMAEKSKDQRMDPIIYCD